MTRLLGYELRRLLLNKVFLALLAITGIFGYQVLAGNTIRGVAHTAPFSEWSYGAYLSAVLPLPLIALLFFITFLYTPHEKRVAAITEATPIDPRAYRAVRCLAMIVGYLVLVVMAVGIAWVWYAQVFGLKLFSAFIVPTLMTALPAMLLVLGVGLLAGRVHVGLLYALMLALLLLGQASLPLGIDWLGVTFFNEYPLTLPLGADGEPAFTVPGIVTAARWAIALTGAVLASVTVGRKINGAGAGRG